MFCPNCGKQLPEDAKFCPECGAPAGRVVERKPEIREEYHDKKTMMKCPDCGGWMAKTATKCPHCGSQRAYIVKSVSIFLVCLPFIMLLYFRSIRPIIRQLLGLL